MKNNEVTEFSAAAVSALLISYLKEMVQHSHPELIVNKTSFLKADTELDVYQFSDLLIRTFNVTGWVSQHGMLIKCFAKHDFNIEQLANKINALKQEDAGKN